MVSPERDAAVSSIVQDHVEHCYICLWAVPFSMDLASGLRGIPLKVALEESVSLHECLKAAEFEMKLFFCRVG